MTGPDSTRSRRPATAEPEQPKPFIRWVGYVLLTLLLVGAVAGYILLGRESTLAGTLPLPKALQTHSAAHEDLMLYGRALNELAVEAESRLPEAVGVAHPLTPRMIQRVQHLHDVGRQLEPRVSREESRVLMAFQQAEGLLRAFIQGEGEPPYDHELITEVRQQISNGMQLGRGQEVNQLILGKKPRPSKPAAKKQGGLDDPLMLLHGGGKDALKLPTGE